MKVRIKIGFRVSRAGTRPAPALETLNLIVLVMDTLDHIFIRMIHLKDALPILAVALPL